MKKWMKIQIKTWMKKWMKKKNSHESKLVPQNSSPISLPDLENITKIGLKLILKENGLAQGISKHGVADLKDVILRSKVKKTFLVGKPKRKLLRKIKKSKQ